MAGKSSNALWVFGYGSLMWRPDFPFVERKAATISGYHRAFCIASTLHRGTQHRPGLVLGLDRGQTCRGVAYRVADELAPGVLTYLRRRELIYGVYRETHVAARLGDGDGEEQALVLAYAVERHHPSYAGGLPMAVQAQIIRGAKGRSGANLDYLINTVRHLQALGVRERGLERLMALSAGHAAAGPPDVMTRPAVAARLGAWRRRPVVDLRVPKGDQRRFGHRVRISHM